MLEWRAASAWEQARAARGSRVWGWARAGKRDGVCAHGEVWAGGKRAGWGTSECVAWGDGVLRADEQGMCMEAVRGSYSGALRQATACWAAFVAQLLQ